MGETGRINVRAFIEGVEVPVISAKVEEGIGSSPQCTLQLPFANEGREIIERSLVHVFYYDPDKVDYDRPASGSDDRFDILGQTSFGKFSSGDPRRFKLLFFGEVSARGRLISQGANQLVITCLGLGNYFDYIKQYMAIRGQGTFTDEERRLFGVNEPFGRTGRSGRNSTADRIVEIIRERGSNIQEGVTSIISEFINRTNSFYTNRYALLRMADLITSIPDDNTADQLMDLDLFKRFVRQEIGQVGYQMTIRGLLGLLGSFLFYEVVEHPSPSYFPKISRDVQQQLSLQDGDADSQVIRREDQVDKMTSILFKPELWWTAPPACNIIFPGQYSAIQETDFRLAEPTRTILKIAPGVRGSRRTIGDKFFAPNLNALNTMAANVQESDMHFYLLPHERFRGVNSNGVMINEIARLVGRDGYESYLQSYVQFQHWRTSYQSRTIYVDSKRLLPQILVGYPAVVIDRMVGHMAPVDDPNQAERVRLARERAALQRCIARLQASISSRRARLAKYEAARYYLEWMNEHWQAMDEADRLGRGAVGGQPVATSDHSVVRRSFLVVLRGLPGGTRNPVQDRTTLLQIFGDNPRAADIIPPENGDSITIDTSNEPAYHAQLEYLLSLIDPALQSLLAEISRLQALLERANAFLLQVSGNFRDLGVATGNYKHFIFYVTGKVTTIDNGGSQGAGVSTSIFGSHSRVHDEDIDLDGIRGDSFENIIKTGTGEFFSDIYAPSHIGNFFYLPHYGTRSLLDLAVEVQASSTADPDPEPEVVDAEGDGIPGLREFLLECSEEVNEDTAEGITVKDALETVVAGYRQLGQSNTDPNSFVTLATSRPIATMFDVFGAGTFEGLPQSIDFGNYRGAIHEGKEPGVGFHQFAFLDENGELDTSGLDVGESGEQSEIAQARKDMVVAYVSSLSSKARIG